MNNSLNVLFFPGTGDCTTGEFGRCSSFVFGPPCLTCSPLGKWSRYRDYCTWPRLNCSPYSSSPSPSLNLSPSRNSSPSTNSGRSTKPTTSPSSSCSHASNSSFNPCQRPNFSASSSLSPSSSTSLCIRPHF